MEVEGINSEVLSNIQTNTTIYNEPAVEETFSQEQPQIGELPEPEATEQGENDIGEIKGVIRNLLDGHFKGVADVRLRINHFEELAAIEGENTKATAEQEVANVLGAVESGVSNLLNSSEFLTAEETPEDKAAIVTELHQQFNETVNQLNQEFQSAQTPSIDNLINGIEDAFSVFIEALQNLLIPATEEGSGIEGENLQSQPLDENIESDAIEQESNMEQQEEPTNEVPLPTPTDTLGPDIVENENQINNNPAESEPQLTEVETQNINEPEPTLVETPTSEEPQTTATSEPNYQDLIDELENAFSTAIAELSEALNVSHLLPELSEPGGNGVAYEKFLAIYNTMWGIDEDGNNTAGSWSVDLIA